MALLPRYPLVLGQGSNVNIRQLFALLLVLLVSRLPLQFFDFHPPDDQTPGAAG